MFAENPYQNVMTLKVDIDFPFFSDYISFVILTLPQMNVCLKYSVTRYKAILHKRLTALCALPGTKGLLLARKYETKANPSFFLFFSF